MNLINAALKRKEFKSKKRDKDALIHYGLLKPRVSTLFNNLLKNGQNFLQNSFRQEATTTIGKGLLYLHLFCASYKKMGGLGEKRWQGKGTKGLCPLYGKHLT